MAICRSFDGSKQGATLSTGWYSRGFNKCRALAKPKGCLEILICCQPGSGRMIIDNDGIRVMMSPLHFCLISDDNSGNLGASSSFGEIN